MPTDSQYRIAAMKKHACDSRIEIDDCTTTTELVIPDNRPGENGAWVKAWLWISGEEAAKEEDPDGL